MSRLQCGYGIFAFSNVDAAKAAYAQLERNGTYKYYWLYRVIFGIPATNLATKGDSITFSTPSIEGTIYRRNKLDRQNKHPWKVEANEGDASPPASVLSGWFDTVYEPTFNPANANLSALTIGSLTLTPAFSGSTTAYTTATTNATNTVTATAVDGNAAIVITNGSTPVTNGQSATWAEGANTLTSVVISGTLTKTYTVTVTKS